MEVCQVCGKELSNDAKFCPNCGADLSINIDKAAECFKSNNDTKKDDNIKTSGFAITGFVLSFCSLLIDILGITSLLGIIFSSIGLSHTKNGAQNGRGLAITGLIISSICFAYRFITLMNAYFAILSLI